MLGEETVLLKALEGKRGQPEQRPPYPTERGLFDKPTVVNNVQTLAAVPWIVKQGGPAFAAIGSKASPGTILVQLRGPEGAGVAEVPLGTPLRELVALVGGSGSRTAQGRPRRRAHRRPAPRGPAGHPLRVRRAARGRRPHRVRLGRDRGRARVHRGPRPAPDPVLGGRGLRQVDPLPDRPAPPVRDRRPDRVRAPDSPPTRPSSRTSRTTSRRAACATTSAWRPFRSRAGCDTSAPRSTTTSFAAPALPASATRSRWRRARRHRDPADGRPDHPPRQPDRAPGRRTPGPALGPGHDHRAGRLARRAAGHHPVPAAAAEHAADPDRGGRPRRRGLRGPDDPRGLPGQRHRDPDPVLRAQAAGLRRLPDVRGRGRGRGRRRRSPALDRRMPAWSSGPRPTSCAGCGGRTWS